MIFKHMSNIFFIFLNIFFIDDLLFEFLEQK